MGEPKPTVEEQAADWVIRLGEGELDARITKNNVVGQFGQRSEDTPYHQAALWADYRLAELGLAKATIGVGGAVANARLHPVRCPGQLRNRSQL